jgi:hypothetical protein
VDTAEMLVRRGANALSRNTNGGTALSMGVCATKEFKDLVEIVKAADAAGPVGPNSEL